MLTTCMIFPNSSKVFLNPTPAQSLAMTKWSNCGLFECLCVFSDRLISISDRDLFQTMITDKCKEKFKKDGEKLITIKPLLILNVTALIFPDGENTKNLKTISTANFTTARKLTKLHSPPLVPTTSGIKPKRWTLCFSQTLLNIL